jgi:hypothetical protein
MVAGLVADPDGGLLAEPVVLRRVGAVGREDEGGALAVVVRRATVGFWPDDAGGGLLVDAERRGVAGVPAARVESDRRGVAPPGVAATFTERLRCTSAPLAPPPLLFLGVGVAECETLRLRWGLEESLVGILLPELLRSNLRRAVASRISRMPCVRRVSSPENVPRHFMIQPWTELAGGRERLRPSG